MSKIVALSRRGWIKRIGGAWRQLAGDIIRGTFALGDELIAAKAALAHGEFLSMIETDLPFTDRMARMFMSIARDSRLRNRNHGSILPPSWRTLYELTRLDDDEFAQFLGQLSPTTERSEIGVFRRMLLRSAYDERAEEGGTVQTLEGLARSGARFSAIYADPPWSFKVYSGKGKQRSADTQYDTMDLTDICLLPIEELAADDCALFLWAVMPELPGALKVIKSWGFEYKTCAFTWVKQNRGGAGLFTGMGYWTRANAELCLLATRGSPKRLALDVHQVVMTPVGQHSAKPPEVRTRIERLLAGPYLELFGRAPADGWTVWGNEVEAVPFEEAAE